MKMQITPELLKKYAADQCTAAEKEAVEKWLNQHPHEDTSKLVATTDQQEVRIWNTISNTTKSSPSKKGKKRQVLYASTAVVLILITTSLGWYLSQPELVTHRTDFGQLRTLILEDGSTAYLNANSELRFPEHFEAVKRELWLDGEAFFEVAKDAGRPFIVHTPTSQTRVLGTSFNLSAFKDTSPTLTLKEGKVSFKGNGQAEAALVLPNEQVTLINGKVQKRKVNSENYSLWMEGKFYVDGDNLISIGKKIRQLYGVHLDIARPELGRRSFRGTLANDDFNALMEELGFVLDFTYEREGNLVTIK
ncbi:MAG: FecR domain-containing protein [Bacteroidota bacterium]